MEWLRVFGSRLRGIFRKRHLDGDLDAEVRSHLEMLTAENIRRGMNPEEARHAARREFGGVEQTKELYREQRGLPFLDALVQDSRFALRGLEKRPMFAAVAILTLALGVGANTAIFSAVRMILLKPLPYARADRLVTVTEADPGTPNPTTVDFTTVQDWKTRSQSFERISLYRDGGGALLDENGVELLRGQRVNYDFFDTLGVQIRLGRAFLAEEDRPDRRYVAILSHGLWVRRFGSDPAVIGRVLRLSGKGFTVVGVLPADFHPLLISLSDPPPDIYTALGYDLSQPSACRGCQHLQAIARVKEEASIGQARAELQTIMRQIVREHAKDYDPQADALVTPLREALTGRVSKGLWILMGAAGFVLLITCANVMNLVLARGLARTKEMAVRAALGAGRRRLIQLALTESLVLALGGGVAGVLLAVFGTSTLASLGPVEIPRVTEITVDGPVLAFGLAVSILTGVIFGVVPALRASRIDVQDALQSAGKITDDRRRGGLRNLLVTAELAFAFVLVLGAGLLSKSFLRVMQVDPGYDAHQVLTLGTYVYGEKYKKPEVELNYYQQALEQVRAIPGVESAAMVSTMPLSGFDRRGFHIKDRRLANESEAPSVDAYSVSPDYFRTMRIPVKQGRTFTEQDRAGEPLAAIISESCARTEFPNENVIGKQIQLGGREDSKPWATIVGVAGDVRQYGLDRAAIMSAYIPQAQDLSFVFQMVARTKGDPAKLETAVRDAFLGVDKTLPVFNVTPMETYLAATLAERTFTLLLLALFGTLALGLAAVGIYGVTSYGVSRRTREFGIRMALGARRSDVVRMVLREASRVIAAGVAAGFVASLVVARILETLLFEVRPADLTTAGATALALGGVALAGCYIPARRAMRVDPMVALRYE